MSLKYHPGSTRCDTGAHCELHSLADKNVGDGAEEAAETFKVVQQAYETLIDPQKRRAFDSIVDDDFDDIPTGNEDKARFYETYGPVFTRFSMWSEIKPPPLLGEDDADIAEVDTFYNFWFEFKSWRDFSANDEYDLEDASDRYERRWMEQQNAKERKSLMKEHLKTVRKLTQLAFDRDPRLARQRAAEREAKEAKKKEKFEAKQRELAKQAEAAAAEEAKRQAELDKEKEDAAAAKKEKEVDP